MADDSHAAHPAWPQWAFLDAFGDGAYGVDQHGCCVFVNKAALRLLGYARADELLGRNMHEAIHHTRPDGSPFPQAECPLLHTAVTGRPVRLDNEMLWRRDGSPFFAEYSSFPMVVDGRVTGSLITFSDTATRQDAQKRLAVQYAVSQVLAGDGPVDAMLRHVVEAVGTGLGWEVGFAWCGGQAGAEPGQLHCLAAWAARDAGPGGGFAAGHAGRMVDETADLLGGPAGTDRPVLVAELKRGLDRQGEAAGFGLRSAVGFPLMDGRRPVGAAEFFSRNPIALDDILLETLSTLGHQVGQALVRRRVAEDLRSSQSLTAAILASAPDCLVTVDRHGRILVFNDAAERTFGHRATDVLGRDLAALVFPPEAHAGHRRAFARALAGDGAVLGRRIEVEAVRADGSLFPAELSLTRTADGAEPLFTAYLRDITARRGEQAQLRENEARFRTIANAIPQLAWMTGPDGFVTWYNQRWYDYTGTSF